MTGRKVTWHGANCGGVRGKRLHLMAACSLLVPGELKVAALGRNVFTTLKMRRKGKNVNIWGGGGCVCNPLADSSPRLWDCFFLSNEKILRS